MFACCHTALSRRTKLRSASRSYAHFSPAEIAKAFLTTEAAIAKRLTRAKQKIRDERIPFEIPAGDELSRRLDACLATLYLAFQRRLQGPAAII